MEDKEEPQNKQSQTEPQEQRQIGDWMHTCDLGRGAFGVVKLYSHQKTNEQIAVKVYKLNKNVELASWNKQRTRWLKEVETMQLISHPNVVSYKDLPEVLREGLSKNHPSSLPFIPMEYCRLGNLRQMLEKPRNLSGLTENDFREVVWDITNGLIFLHTLKITHRDLKPDNIVVQINPERKSDRLYKIIDLGFAKELGSIENSVVGTFHYLAPEIMTNKPYNCSVDYFSWGVTVFQLACGVLPFDFGWVEYLEFIEKKRPEDICIYYSQNGSLVYSKNLKPENNLTNCLKENLEVWLRHALQYDPEKRLGPIDKTPCLYFLAEILSRRIVEVFDFNNLEFFSFEIASDLTVGEFKDFLGHNTNIEGQFDLCTNKEILHDNAVVLNDEIRQFVVIKKSCFFNSKINAYPVLIREALRCNNVNSNCLKQLYSQSIYFVNSQKKLLDAFAEGLEAYVRLARFHVERVVKSYMEMSKEFRIFLSNQKKYNEYRRMQIDHYKIDRTLKEYRFYLGLTRNNMNMVIHSDLQKRIARKQCNEFINNQALLETQFKKVKELFATCTMEKNILEWENLLRELAKPTHNLKPIPAIVNQLRIVIKEKSYIFENADLNQFGCELLKAIKSCEFFYKKSLFETARDIKELLSFMMPLDRMQFDNLLPFGKMGHVSKEFEGKLQTLKKEIENFLIVS